MLGYMGFSHRTWDPNAFAMFRAEAFRKLMSKTQEFDSFSDWPWPLVVPNILDQFGDRARFILTRRSSPAVWINSLKGHSMITEPRNNAREMVYGYEYPQENEQAHVEFYEAHLQKTRDLFKNCNLEHTLLEVCWEDGAGWQDVADFLEVPVPNIPMPHKNSSQKRNEFIPYLAENMAHIKKIDRSFGGETRHDY
jgi:hypothetical protein